jgi:hypothetical protein
MNEGVLDEDTLLNNVWVEGSDDAHLMYQLLKSYSLEDKVKIEDKKGIENILKALPIALKLRKPRRLGIIVDADDDLDRRWQSFYNILVATGYNNVPSVPIIAGTIITQTRLPEIGIWLMPNNQMTGMLEHFASALIHPSDILWPMACDVVQEVIATKCNFASVHQRKAEIHTWLAWQEEPGKPMGQAITKRYLDAGAPHAQKLIAWLRNLFALDVV